MPIRIDRDNDNYSPDNSNGSRPRFTGGGGGGGGGLLMILLMFLPQIIRFLLRNPKLGVVVVLVLIGLWFFRDRIGLGGNQPASSAYSRGCSMNQELYDQAQVYEPLADNIKNPMPERVSLLQYAPKRLNQGQQGSCVAWASSYAARSIMYARESGKNPDEIAFSPSFLYNQIALEDCQGSYLINAMETLEKKGDVDFDKFPYNENSCSKDPDSRLLSEASAYRIKGFSRLSLDGEDYKVNMLAIKQNLAAGAPVVIGMQVGGSFMRNMDGKKVWIPESSDYDMSGFGGHAMCVIGYDDYLEGGAFQLMNSWGPEWGDNGTAWVRYKDFDFFVVEAMGLHPMGEAGKAAPASFTASFGLQNQNTKTNIPFGLKNGNVFTNRAAVKKGKAGTPFKIEFTNNMECYTYLVGLENNNTTYVLFPYTKKHSPYCGVTGTRLFPKDHTLYPDDAGSTDQMAVIITHEPIDYNALNAKISSATGQSLGEKINKALAGKLSPDAKLSTDANGNVRIDKPLNDKGYAAIILEVKKQ
jgi:hypothetical protein